MLFLFSYITACHAAGAMRGIHLDRIQLPPGFSIQLYAAAVPNARSLTMSPKGVLFVGTRQAGKIYAVLDTDQDHVADEVITIAEGLNMPNGVAFRNGALYVAEVNRILRYENIEKSLGMKFYTGKQFPAQYDNQIFIAEHGSWNRSIPVGYRITLVNLAKNKPTKYVVFAEGWLQGDTAWGRPVDILVMPDGALLVSDDRAGVIYRIAYGK